MVEDKGQAPESTQSQEDKTKTSDSSAESQSLSTQTDDKKTFDAEYVSKLRGENAGYRTELKKAQDELKKFSDAQLSEQEKAVKRATDAEAKVLETEAKAKDRMVRSEVKLSASKLGIVDPDVAYRLLDTSEITFDSEGEPNNLEKLLTQLVKDKPYLVGSNGSHSAANAERSKGTLTIEDIKKMKPDEINRSWDEVQIVMAAQK